MNKQQEDILHAALINLQEAAGVVSQLEATLAAERSASAKLVEQLTVLEAAAEKTKDMESRLAREEHRAAEFERHAKELEAAVTTEQARAGELSSRLAGAERGLLRLSDLEAKLEEAKQAIAAGEARSRDLEKAQTKVQECEALLTTERDRNAVLARRVAESEQNAEQANKRFEDMARKLGEIAGLASQLGTGKGRA